jgi:hypothetical protein
VRDERALVDPARDALSHRLEQAVRLAPHAPRDRRPEVEVRGVGARQTRRLDPRAQLPLRASRQPRAGLRLDAREALVRQRGIGDSVRPGTAGRRGVEGAMTP